MARAWIDCVDASRAAPEHVQSEIQQENQQGVEARVADRCGSLGQCFEAAPHPILNGYRKSVQAAPQLVQ